MNRAIAKRGRGSRGRNRRPIPALWPVLVVLAAVLLAAAITITYVAARRQEKERRDWVEYRRGLGLDTAWVPAPHQGHVH